jgi:conjugal transfer/entry exclusion protein
MNKMRNKRILSRKRGQLEIMGLAIIVILVAVAALFAIKFVLMKPESALPVIDLSIKANNGLNAIIKADFKCYYEG